MQWTGHKSQGKWKVDGGCQVTSTLSYPANFSSSLEAEKICKRSHGLMIATYYTSNANEEQFVNHLLNNCTHYFCFLKVNPVWKTGGRGKERRRGRLTKIWKRTERESWTKKERKWRKSHRRRRRRTIGGRSGSQEVLCPTIQLLSELRGKGRKLCWSKPEDEACRIAISQIVSNTAMEEADGRKKERKKHLYKTFM